MQESGFPCHHQKSTASIPLIKLPAEAALSIFAAQVFLRGRSEFDGPACHGLMGQWIAAGAFEERGLHSFLQLFCTDGAHYWKRFAQAVQWAEQRIKAGWWVAAWRDGACFPKDCPKVVFGRGTLDLDVRWLAVFNSRKSKLTSPDAQWLAALRQALADHLPGAATGIAGSCGTTSYDLLTVLARHQDRPLCLVLPFPLDVMTTDQQLASLLAGNGPELALTCQSAALRCPKADRLRCRDRLLAHLADIHLALEIRAGGNLHGILQERHASRPGRLIVLRPAVSGPQNAANFSLMETFPDAETFQLQSPAKTTPGVASPAPPRLCGQALPTREYWNHYLYHYTRACPGPWPGQSYRDYLLALWEHESLCGHSALETLVRILREQRLRAASRITRGAQPVISWSARPPSEMAAMRQWNRALIRWTFEPYGIAISKDVLRTLGAKPAIYGRDGVFSRLPDDERFRYQRHEPPACAWKQEREWRSPGDLRLDERCRRHGFIFVDSDADADYVARCAETDLPIMVLSALHRTAGSLP